MKLEDISEFNKINYSYFIKEIEVISQITKLIGSVDPIEKGRIYNFLIILLQII